MLQKYPEVAGVIFIPIVALAETGTPKEEP
jgi:hypothetical protein